MAGTFLVLGLNFKVRVGQASKAAVAISCWIPETEIDIQKCMWWNFGQHDRSTVYRVLVAKTAHRNICKKLCKLWFTIEPSNFLWQRWKLYSSESIREYSSKKEAWLSSQLSSCSALASAVMAILIVGNYSNASTWPEISNLFLFRPVSSISPIGAKSARIEPVEWEWEPAESNPCLDFAVSVRLPCAILS